MINKYDQKYKDFLATRKRYDEVWEELRKRPLIKLEEPYQKGWILYLDFRSDIKNRRDYPAIKEAFDLAHYETWTRNVKFVKRIRANRRLDTLQRESQERHRHWLPELRLINQRTYENLRPEIKKWFDLDSYQEKWSSFRGHFYWINIPRYWLEIKTRPNMMTHAYQKGGALEKEYFFLKKKMEEGWRLFLPDLSSSYPANVGRMKTRDSIQKFRKGEREDIDNEKIPRIYNY